MLFSFKELSIGVLESFCARATVMHGLWFLWSLVLGTYAFTELMHMSVPFCFEAVHFWQTINILKLKLNILFRAVYLDAICSCFKNCRKVRSFKF